MNIKDNVQTVKDFFAALGRRDKQGLLALAAADIESIIPGEDRPLAGTHRGHTGLGMYFKSEKWNYQILQLTVEPDS